jgi:hypothetical protein
MPAAVPIPKASDGKTVTNAPGPRIYREGLEPNDARRIRRITLARIETAASAFTWREAIPGSADVAPVMKMIAEHAKGRA